MNDVPHLRPLPMVTAVALVLAALLVLPARPAAGEPVTCTRTFSSGTINARIPDKADFAGVVASDIDVPEDGLLVADVDVTLNVRHPAPADLEARAISYPDGLGRERDVSILFVRGNADGPGADMLGTVFDDDDATALISQGVSPFTGRFLPIGRLSRMDGFSGGVYRLVLIDHVAGNAGTLVSWSVTLTLADCDADGDGVLTFADRCPRLRARTVTGCPELSRGLAARYARGKFRGALVSSASGCEAGRVVSVFKVRSGPDRRISTVTTRADGSWLLARAKKRGRYYATSPRVVVAGVADCRASTSPTFRVR